MWQKKLASLFQTSGEALITSATSSRPKEADSLSSTMTRTDGWISISPMEIVLVLTGQLAKNQLRISTRTIVTAHLPMSQKNPGSHAPAGRQAYASAITTMTDGTTCFAVFGDTTFCSTTTAMGLSPGSPKKLAVY